MFEVNLVDTCGGILPLALEESLGKGKAIVIGPSVDKMKFLDWKPKLLTKPLSLDALGEYDFVICIQCLSELQGLKLVNINNKIYAASGSKLIDLTKEQSRQANAFMKKAGINIRRGTSVVLPLGLHNFLAKVEQALKPEGKAVFIDYGDSEMFNKLTLMKDKSKPFSRFLAETKAGKLHVLNCNSYLARSPHFIRDSAIIDILKRLKCESKIIPWLDVQDMLSAEEKDVLQPFVVKASSVFLGWGDIVLDYIQAAKRIKRDIVNADDLTELYAASFVLGNPLEGHFVDDAWARATQISNLPPNPPLFSIVLQK